MESNNRNREDLLLDFHLDRLDGSDREWIEAELLRDVELRHKSDRLGQALRPLDHWSVASPTGNLVDRVLARVERESAPASPASPAVGMDQVLASPRRSFVLPMKEVLAVAASIALLLSVLIPGIGSARAEAQRAMCASNLSSIFQGTFLYQQAFNESLPYAGTVSGSVWLPGVGNDRPYASNSRHPYLLAKFSFGPKPEHFICPADRGAVAMRADDLANYDDFASTRNNSYDSLNLTGESPNLRPGRAIAYLSDRNPLFRNGRFDQTVNPHTANSLVHNGKGQVVLTLDGSARWITTPVYNASGDNLWMAGDIRDYQGTESPTASDDAQLVPGYPTTDPEVKKYLMR